MSKHNAFTPEYTRPVYPTYWNINTEGRVHEAIAETEGFTFREVAAILFMHALILSQFGRVSFHSMAEGAVNAARELARALAEEE